MRKIIGLAAIGAALTLGTFQARAQSTNTNTVTFTTNVTQTINIALTGLESSGGSNSGSATPVRITTKDLLSDIGMVTGATFSPRAKLIAVTPVGGGSTAFVVRDGNNTNGDVDVSAFLRANTLAQA